MHFDTFGNNIDLTNQNQQTGEGANQRKRLGKWIIKILIKMLSFLHLSDNILSKIKSLIYTEEIFEDEEMQHWTIIILKYITEYLIIKVLILYRSINLLY